MNNLDLLTLFLLEYSNLTYIHTTHITQTFRTYFTHPTYMLYSTSYTPHAYSTLPLPSYTNPDL